MKDVIIFTSLTGLALLIFILTFVFGFLKKKRKLKLFSIFAFIAFMGLACLTGFKVVSKSYHKFNSALKPRTGQEIYNALFDKPQFDCVRVLHHQDQVVPKIDYAIWLHFETCPDELKRILSRHKYSGEIKSTKYLDADGPSANEKWFNPAILGDSVFVFSYKMDEYGNGQTIYSSLDSTKVYCIDIID